MWPSGHYLHISRIRQFLYASVCSEWIIYVCISSFWLAKTLFMSVYSWYYCTYDVCQRCWRLKWHWNPIPMLMWKSSFCSVEFQLVLNYYSTVKHFYIVYFSGSTISKWYSIVVLSTWLPLFRNFQICQLYHVNLYYIDILQLTTYERLFSFIQKSLIGSRSPLLYGTLYKPSDLVSLMKLV